MCWFTWFFDIFRIHTSYMYVYSVMCSTHHIICTPQHKGNENQQIWRTKAQRGRDRISSQCIFRRAARGRTKIFTCLEPGPGKRGEFFRMGPSFFHVQKRTSRSVCFDVQNLILFTNSTKFPLWNSHVELNQIPSLEANPKITKWCPFNMFQIVQKSQPTLRGRNAQDIGIVLRSGILVQEGLVGRGIVTGLISILSRPMWHGKSSTKKSAEEQTPRKKTEILKRLGWVWQRVIHNFAKRQQTMRWLTFNTIAMGTERKTYYSGIPWTESFSRVDFGIFWGSQHWSQSVQISKSPQLQFRSFFDILVWKPGRTRDSSLTQKHGCHRCSLVGDLVSRPEIWSL